MTTFAFLLKCGTGTCLAGVLAFCPTGGARAQTIWTGQSGDWFVPANWSAGVPNSTADPQINNGGTAEINAAGARSRNVYLGFNVTDFGHLFVSGPGTLQNTFLISVGHLGMGAMTVMNGGIISTATGSIGGGPGSVGAVVVDGVGSIWNSGDVYIGGSGSGTLTILNGGGVNNGMGLIAGRNSSAGGIGRVTVSGPGSTWNNTGSVSVNGSLSMQSGGTVASDAAFVDGVVVIDGAGSSWTNGQLTVGNSANGGVIIRNGGALRNNGTATIGSNRAYGSVLVDGAGSAWEGDLDHVKIQVGFHFGGGLALAHGGGVSTYEVGVGIGRGSDGTVVVDGVGSALNVRTNLYVGGGAIGDSRPEPGGTGLVEIYNSGKICATTTTIFAQGRVFADGILISPSVIIQPAGLLAGDGIVSGSVSSAGRVQAGDWIGSLMIDGNYTQLSSGKLTLEVAGISSETYDHLNITGSAMLDGTLEVRFVDGFLPVQGQVFELLHVSGAVTGSFTRIAFPDLRSGFQFSATFVDGRYRLTALNDGVAARGLLNLSTRVRVGPGDEAFIGGFIVTGNDPKKVLLRGLGPSLSVNGRPLAGSLADPTLELRGHDGGLIAANDNWRESPQRAEIIASGIPPDDDREAAIVATLAPGNYTAIMRGIANTTGLGIVEVYDLEPDASSSLANISTRGFVGTGDNAMIGGFIVDSQTTDVLLRALGPSLAQAGVGHALADPTLELRDGNGAVVAFNNDWRETDEAAIQNTGIPPSASEESAILASLPPGNYTAIVRGRNAATGVGLFEGYNLR